MAEQSRTDRTLLCDTNVLVRLLTNEPPSHARAASRVLNRPGGSRILISDAVFAELAYVLDAALGVPRASSSAFMQRVLDLPRVDVIDDVVLRDALMVWEGRRLDFVDAYLAGLARRIPNCAILSFDRDFDRIPGVRRVDPQALGDRPA